MNDSEEVKEFYRLLRTELNSEDVSKFEAGVGTLRQMWNQDITSRITNSGASSHGHKQPGSHQHSSEVKTEPESVEFAMDNIKEDEEEEYTIDDDDNEEDDALTREELTPEEEEFKGLCQLIAGNINIDLREVWRYRKDRRLEKVKKENAFEIQETTKKEKMQKANTSTKHEKIKKEPPDSHIAGKAHTMITPIPAPRPPPPPPPPPHATTAHIHPNALFQTRDAQYLELTFRRYLTETSMSAFLHVLYLIRELKNPAVSYLPPYELFKRYRVPFVSWVSLMIQYQRNITGDSPLYKSKHAMFALSNLMERHRLLFSKMS
jgi:hypothetical protein